MLEISSRTISQSLKDVEKQGFQLSLNWKIPNILHPRILKQC